MWCFAIMKARNIAIPIRHKRIGTTSMEFFNYVFFFSIIKYFDTKAPKERNK